MTSTLPETSQISIRPIQYRDLEVIAALSQESCETNSQSSVVDLAKKLQRLKRWYGLLKFLSLLPNPCQYNLGLYVAEQNQKVIGAIDVNPFNVTRSTWRVEQVLVDLKEQSLGSGSGSLEKGSQLLRYCFEKIWEARTWILEVNINHKTTLALYRHNGFQPLAQMTYWAISPDQLEQLAQRPLNPLNLLPVSNADAQLLYQLDTVAMPPQVRQVFDRHIQDFKVNFLDAIRLNLGELFHQTEVVKGYVFEPQRKAAIGYFRLEVCRNGSKPHKADLTVHPAYTWLYPELFSQMAQIVKDYPPQALQLVSADYQPEREEYLEKLGAQRIEHTLLMSRSVWHKLRETRHLEGLQWSDMLQSLQPARPPVPSRVAWRKSLHQKLERPDSQNPSSSSHNGSRSDSQDIPQNGHHG